MLLGKTGSMRRTSSLTEFAADAILADVEDTQQAPQEQENTKITLLHRLNLLSEGRASLAVADWLEGRYQGSLMLPSPLGGRQRRSSLDLAVVDMAHFLKACGLCKRHLGPGRDTFMYSGIAFCSLECRQQHINKEENKENCSLTPNKDIPPEQPDDAEMIVAACDAEMIVAA